MKENRCPSLYLAPMAGAGDRAFRETCALFGADFFCTEMISAKAFCYQDQKTALLAEMGELARPCAIQLFGKEPEILSEAAARIAEEYSPEGIDLNFGCPVPKIAGNGEGSALMRTPDLCGRIVEAVCRAVTIPVTVKIRAGWDEASINAPVVASVCEAAGASAVAVHGRLRQDFYRDGTVKPQVIAAVKAAVKIPVIGNGDVRDGASARKLLETGCDALMIGRAAIGAPWVFAAVRADLEGREIPKIDRKAAIRFHMEAAFRYKPKVAAREMRMHMAHYLKGFRGAAALREEASHGNCLEDYLSLLERLPEEESREG